MLPTTGPFLTTTRIPALPAAAFFYKEQRKYKQAKPYDLKLPYSVRTTVEHVGSYGASNNFNAYYIGRTLQETAISPYDSYYESAMTFARNKAISRFNDGLGTTASLGVSMAETRESVGMITKRAKSLFMAARSIKKLRFGDAFRHLGLEDVTPRDVRVQRKSRRDKEIYFLKTPRQKRGVPSKIHKVSLTRTGAHQFSNNWLEVSFGWVPFVRDMYSAMEVISNGPDYYISPVKATGTQEITYQALFSSTNYESVINHVVKHQVSLAADVRVLNENKNLSRRLGIVNPFAVLWEIIPFSFVLDYFFNIGEWLEQFNQHYGVSVSNPHYTDKMTDRVTGNNKYRPNVNSPWVDNFVDSTATSAIRTVGSLPLIRLGRKPSYYLGIGRALNNVSLLVKLFVKER